VCIFFPNFVNISFEKKPKRFSFIIEIIFVGISLENLHEISLIHLGDQGV